VMTGRRLRHAHVAMIGLVVAIVLAFWFAGALDGVSPRPFPRRLSVPWTKVPLTVQSCHALFASNPP